MSRNGNGRGYGQVGGNGDGHPSPRRPPVHHGPGSGSALGSGPAPGDDFGYHRPTGAGEDADLKGYTPVDFGFAVLAGAVGLLLAGWVVYLWEARPAGGGNSAAVASVVAATAWLPFCLIGAWPAVFGLLRPHPRRKLAALGLVIALLPPGLLCPWLLYHLIV